MANLTIIAHIVAHPDKIELVRNELLKLIEPTRAEEGCIKYELHQDNNNPAHLVFHENWSSRELWQDHMGSDHILRYLQATQGAVESFTIQEMTRTG